VNREWPGAVLPRSAFKVTVDHHRTKGFDASDDIGKRWASGHDRLRHVTAPVQTLVRPADTSLGASIAVRDLTVTYPNGFTAVRDMPASVSIPRGSICALVGVNGSRQVDPVQGDHGLRARWRVARCELLRPARSTQAHEEAIIVAYVPQSEDVDWNFPVLVEDRGDDGPLRPHEHFLRMPPSRSDRDMVTSRRWSAWA
jgi:manganese/iron transport system ATP-binding protein